MRWLYDCQLNEKYNKCSTDTVSLLVNLPVAPTQP